MAFYTFISSAYLMYASQRALPAITLYMFHPTVVLAPLPFVAFHRQPRELLRWHDAPLAVYRADNTRSVLCIALHLCLSSCIPASTGRRAWKGGLAYAIYCPRLYNRTYRACRVPAMLLYAIAIFTAYRCRHSAGIHFNVSPARTAQRVPCRSAAALRVYEKKSNSQRNNRNRAVISNIINASWRVLSRYLAL